MRKQKKFITIFCVCLAAIPLLILFCATCVDVNVTPSGGGKCISVTFFDKLLLPKVDRVVITSCRSEQKEITITDTQIIHKLVEETAIATHTGLRCAEDVQIDLYIGNWRVRSMTGNLGDKLIVYRQGLFHWILAFGSSTDGIVYLSRELGDILTEIWYQ